MQKVTMKKGFTLIEILVGVAIIVGLSAVVFASINYARERSKVARATADVKQLYMAVANLYSDTGKYPNGCAKNQLIDDEAELDSQNAGLLKKPVLGVLYNRGGITCEWTADDLLNWNGPYISSDKTVDPWGEKYLLDFDYYGKSGGPDGQVYGTGCATLNDGMVIATYGPDKTMYDCDDIVYYIKNCGTKNIQSC